MSEPSRRRFGRYELHEELGRGAMGVVFRAVAVDGGREVALKVLHGARGFDENQLRRFEREARLAARVKHPGVVEVLDAGRERGMPYVAFELVKGRSLAATPLPLVDHVRLLAKIGRAIGAAHRAKVVHRDLKPTNVIVDPSGEPHVVDFGLAFDGSFEASRLSATNEIVGTPAYMAPETILGTGDPDDPRTDVYALGVMLYEHLAGGHPLRGLGTQEALARAPRGLPSLVGKPSIDDTLARLADRATAVEKTRRPADGDVFAEGLEAWLARPRKSVERSARPKGLLVLGGAALLLAVVVGAVLLRRRAEPARIDAPPPPPAKTPPPVAVVTKPARHVRPVAPEPIRLAPPEIVAELDATTDEIKLPPDALRRVDKLARQLQAECPNDARTIHFAAFVDTLFRHEYDGRRGFVRALRASPPLGPRAVRRTVFFLRQLGFERAAAAIAARAYPDERYPAALGATLAFLYLTAMPPLADFERAERIATQGLEGDASGEAVRFQLAAARGQARLALGRPLEAAADFALTASEAERSGMEGAIAIYKERERACRSGEATAEHGPRAFTLNLSPTVFLEAVEKANQKWREWAPDGLTGAARAFGELSDREAHEGRNETAAIAALRASWALRRAGSLAEARAALEKALVLAGGHKDTQALVARDLARLLLADPANAAAAERIALSAVEGAEDPQDERDDDELAEAWALVAQARAVRGDLAGARRALDEAEAWSPVDPRPLAAARAFVEGKKP